MDAHPAGVQGFDEEMGCLMLVQFNMIHDQHLIKDRLIAYAFTLNQTLDVNRFFFSRTFIQTS